MYSVREQGLSLLHPQHKRSILYAELIANWSPAWGWTGRFYEAEQNTREGLAIAREMSEPDLLGYLRDLGLLLSIQGKFQEADTYFQECENMVRELHRSELESTTLRRWQAVRWLKEGKLAIAQETLEWVISVVEKVGYTPAIGEILTWLGLVYESAHQLDIAMNHYTRSLLARGRSYFEGAALTGLVRVKHAQSDYAAIPPLLAEAEQLAQQYEYNDHLASLRLTQGHLALTPVPSPSGRREEAGGWGEGFDAALRYYQHALIYALRYNRFLLDEVLSGRPQGTPLRPIIPECLKRGEEGRRMLIALRDWWQTGVNDIGTPRPDTISPIPEGIPLLEAERIAREREPGDGSPQKSVIEQIENALEEAIAG